MVFPGAWERLTIRSNSLDDPSTDPLLSDVYPAVRNGSYKNDPTSPAPGPLSDSGDQCRARRGQV